MRAAFFNTSEHIFWNVILSQSKSSCIYGCTNVHSFHDNTPLPLSCPAQLAERSGARDISHATIRDCRLVICLGHQRICRVDEYMPSSKRHSRVYASCVTWCFYTTFAALPSFYGLHRDLSYCFPFFFMSKDTKNAGIAYGLSVLIVVAAASLPSIVL